MVNSGNNIVTTIPVATITNASPYPINSVSIFYNGANSLYQANASAASVSAGGNGPKPPLTLLSDMTATTGSGPMMMQEAIYSSGTWSASSLAALEQNQNGTANGFGLGY